MKIPSPSSTLTDLSFFVLALCVSATILITAHTMVQPPTGSAIGLAEKPLAVTPASIQA